MNDTTLQAVQACYELIRWLIPQLEKFLRVCRLTLGERLMDPMLQRSSLYTSLVIPAGKGIQCQGWQAEYIPVAWIPAFPAGMTWLT